MGWFRAIRASFINARYVMPGDVIQYDGPTGSGLEPMSDADLKKHRAAIDAIPPTRSVEQRLDEIELTIGLDNIRQAVENENKRRARQAKADAERAAKAEADKAEAEKKASEPQPNAEKGKAKAEA